uniref:Uncharacterized protein n=1 Tax=Anguilla anguilla TaxID=7936 RepID=A0A0E9XQ50_ANGAN
MSQLTHLSSNYNSNIFFCHHALIHIFSGAIGKIAFSRVQQQCPTQNFNLQASGHMFIFPHHNYTLLS